MRVDGGDAGVDDLETYSGKAVTQHHLEVSGESIGRVGVAPGNRLSHDENPVSSRCLGCGDHEWAWFPQHARGEERRGKRSVITIGWSAVVGAGKCGTGWSSNSDHTKSHF